MSNLLAKTRRVANVVVRETSTDAILSDALSIINSQVQLMRVKSSAGYGLEAEEIKQLRTLVQSLCDISREEREQSKHDGMDEALKNMSEAEILQLYYEKQKKP